MSKPKRSMDKLPLRQSQGLHRCIVCLRDIGLGEFYRDGGWPRRAHRSCADTVAAGARRELSRDELQAVDDAELAIAKAKGEVHKAEVAANGLRLRLLNEADLRPATEAPPCPALSWSERQRAGK